MGEPLIRVVKTFLDDKLRQDKSVKEFDLDKYFKENNNTIVANKAQIIESLSILQNEPAKDYRLYIQVMRKIILASNPNVAEQFNYVKDQLNLLLRENLLVCEANGRPLVLLSKCLSEFTQFCIKASKPAVAIHPLLRCIKFACPTKLSTFRSQATQICFSTSFWQHSLEIIEADLVDVVPETPAMDIVNYYFFSGLIFSGLKRYADAIKAFERVMVIPTKSVCEVHIATFQRLILLSIIEGREDYQLPQSTQDVLKHELKIGDGQLQMENIRHSPLNFTVYEQLVNSAKTKEAEQMSITVETYMDHFLKHETLELAHLATNKVKERKVKNLGDVYLTLGFSEIAQKANLGTQIAAEKYLAKLINEKFLFAQINQETQTVEFQEDTGALDLIETLESQNKRIADLMLFANDLDVSIKTDPEFIHKKNKEATKNVQLEQESQNAF